MTTGAGGRTVGVPGERKLVSVLFADLTGYTALSASLDPEEVYGFLRPTLASLERIVVEFGGTVVFVAGDGFMAVFGVPVSHEDDAERAVRAAIACRDHVRELNLGREGFRFPEVHAGINSGEVIVTPSDEASGFKVIGDTVNTASRTADLAPGGRVLVDADTRARTRAAVEYGPRRLRRAKGKPEPLELYEAIEVRAISAPDRRSGTFVDREGARGRLERELEAAIAEGRSRVTIVSGDPGVGKSALAAEFCQQLPRDRVLVGRCLPFGQRLPLHPVADAVAGAAGTTLDAPSEEIDAALDRLARRVRAGPGATSLASDLRVLTGTAANGPARSSSIGDAIRAARAVVEGLASAGPTVVVLDDLQWADADVRALLDDLGRSPWQGPILCLGLTRSAAAFAAAPVLALDGLDPDSMRELIRTTLGELPTDAMRTSISRSGGNPLFLEESIRMLVESEVLVRDAGGWHLTDPGRLEEVPSTIRLLIAARLDGLLPEEKRVLQDASVCGRSTWDRLIRDVSDVPDPAGVLRSLVARDLLRADEGSAFSGARGYTFKHILIRDVAYESLPRLERARRHLAVATWLRRERRGSRRELIASLAHHYEQSWRLSLTRTGTGPDPEVARSAVRYLSRWAEETRRTQARAAEGIYARALRVTEGSADAVDPLVAAQLLVGRAECLIEMGRHREAVADATHGRALAKKLGDRTLLANALLALGRSESDLGRMDRARRVLREARSLFESEGDLRGQGWALHRLSETWGRANYRREIENLRDAHRLFTQARDRLGRSVAAQDLAYLLTMMGGSEFRHWYDTARRLVEHEGELRSRADLLRTWGVFSYYRGDHSEALRVMKEARPLAADAGDRYAEADAIVIAATAAAVAGDPDEAEELAADGLKLGAELESARIRASALLAAARAGLRRGDPGTAVARLRRARSAVASHGIRVLAGETALMEAWLALDRGSWQRVEEPAERLGREVRAHGWTLLRPLPSLCVGRAHLGAGRFEVAVRHLEHVVEQAQQVDVGGTLALAEALREQAMLLAGRAPLAGARERSQEPEVHAVELENHAIATLRAGDARAAAAGFEEAAASWQAHGVSSWLARALAMEATARRVGGDARAATAGMRRAAGVLDALRTAARDRDSILHMSAGSSVGARTG